VKFGFNLTAFEHSVILHKPDDDLSFYLLTPTDSRTLDCLLLFEVWIIFSSGHSTAIELYDSVVALANPEPSSLPPGWAHARFNGNLDSNKRYQGKWTVLDERGYEYVVEVQKEKRVLVKVRDVKTS
jgi:ribosomal protein L21E